MQAAVQFHLDRTPFYIEGNTRGKNRVFYSGAIEIVGLAVTAEASVQLFLQESPAIRAVK